MEKPPEKGAEKVAQNHGTTFVLRKKGQEEENGWMWKRKSFQGYGHAISLSYRRIILSDIKAVLTDVGGEKLLQQFAEGCFGHLLRFNGGTSCNKALHELISREITLPGARDDELWFRIGETNIRFAPPEYALVTGLCFGSSTFDLLESHEMPPEGLFNRLRSGNPISIRELWILFNQRRLTRLPEDYLKVAHVLALNLMALGYDANKTVERWMWVLVDDLDAWNRFPWGAYTYKALMHFVSILPRASLRRRYHFYGPVWALQIWAYEAIPRLGKASALVSRKVTVPRCLKWSFPRGKKKLPKQFLEQKLECRVTLEPTGEEKRQPYWLSVQTEHPLGVPYASGKSRKQGIQGAGRRRGVLSICRSSIRTPLVKSARGEPGNQVEVPDTDDRLSAPKPSARPSRRQKRTICSSLSSGDGPWHVRQWPELLYDARFADQVSSRVVNQMMKPMAEEVTRILIESMSKLLIPHLKQHIGDLFQAREVDDHLEIANPGDNADCARPDEKKEQSFDGGSSSMFNTGVGGHGKSFANQEDSAVPNDESQLKRDGPILAQSDSIEKAGIEPPRAGEADPFSSKKTMKKKSSSTSKHRRWSPSTNEETSDDEGSESSSVYERRRKMRKRGKKKKRKHSEVSLSESSDSDWHRMRRKRRKRGHASSSESDARGSGRRHHHRRRRPHRHHSVSSSD